MKTKIINISKFFTFDNNSSDLNIVEDYEILIQDGKIVEIAKNCEECKNIIDAKNCIITPGFIDSHTHMIFSSHRANDFSKRISGKTYLDIAKSGGGIKSSINSLRNSPKDKLFNKCKKGSIEY